MTKIDQLIEKFKELKEELNKNVNYSYGRTPNMGNLGGGGSPTFGTSGGQGGMYRSEELDKQAVAPPATMNFSEEEDDDMQKQVMNPSAGGAQDMMMVKFEPNGQWRMEKKHIGFDKLKHKLEGEGHSAESAGNIAYSIGKKKYGKEGMSEKAHEAHKSEETQKGEGWDKMVAKLKREGHSQESAERIAGDINNKYVHHYAHKSEDAEKAEGSETKHDRCAREVKEQNPSVRNPHAVCVAAGVEPDKWKKSVDLADGLIEKLEKVAHYVSEDGKNREANPKLRQSDLGPGGKIHYVKKDEGTNEEANPSKPHNKGKFKVMPMAEEKDSKKAAAGGLPYNGKDKDMKKGEECPKCHRDPCKCMDKSDHHGKPVQGNEAKGFDENKAPGRGTLSV